MDTDFHKVHIDPSLADLIPSYLQNRRKEIQDLEAALQAGEFAEIAKLAERMIGVGTPFGFPYITNAAKTMRAAAARNEVKTVRDLQAAYRSYLKMVRVEFH